MKILLLTDHFYPDLSSGGRLLTDLSEVLAEKGEWVEVITAFSHYNTKESAPRKEEYKGFRIERVFSLQFSRNNILGRILNELSFCFSVFWRALLTARPDVICVISSPPFLPIFVYILSCFRKIPYVYLLMDVFPDMAVKLGLLRPNSMMVRIWNHLTNRALRGASRIIVLGRCMKQVIEGKLNNQFAVPVEVIHNWADRERLFPLERANNPFFDKHPYLRHKFIVQYSGNLGRFQDFETILSAAEELINDPHICFLIIGEGYRRRWLEKEIKQRNLSNTMLLPFQTQENLVYSLNAADVALVTLEKGAEGLGVPSKFYPILAVGKPVIAIMSDSSEVAMTILENNLGFVVQQENVRALVAVIKHIEANNQECSLMGQCARAVFIRSFDRSMSTERYRDVLYQCLEDAGYGCTGSTCAIVQGSR